MKRHCFTLVPFFALIGLVLSPLGVAHAASSPDPVATLSYRGQVSSMSFSPDGTLLAAGGEEWDEDEEAWVLGVQLWDVASRKQVATLQGEGVVWVSSVSFSPDGTLLAVGALLLVWNEDEKEWVHGVQLWDVASRKQVATLQLQLAKGESGVSSVSFSPDGTLLAVGAGRWDEDEEEWVHGVQLWDVASRKQVATLQQEEDAVWVSSVSFSPDGTLLAVGARRWNEDEEAWVGLVQLWDVASRKQVATLQQEEDAVWVSSVSFSPDGTLLAVGARRWNEDEEAWVNLVQLWDVVSRQQVATLQGDAAEVSSVSFSPDGTLLAVGAGRSDEEAWVNLVQLWDVASRQQVATLQGDAAEVSSVSFSPDGTLLATKGDEAILLWDVSEWIPQAWLTPNPAEVEFSADDPAWKTFTVHTSLDSVLVHVNPSGSDPAIEVEGGPRPPTRAYCPAEGNDRPKRGRQDGWSLHVQACQAGQTKILLRDYDTGAVVQQYEIRVEASTKASALTRLNPSYPNPFNSETILSYRLPIASDIRLEVFTLNGQRVAVLHEGFQAAGYHTLSMDASDLASGVYLYRLTTPAGRFVQKFTLLR